MAGLFFLPAAACFDKITGNSSFAHTVAQLRSRSGRLDPSIPAQNWKCDFATVGLYGSGEPDEVESKLQRGIIRFFRWLMPRVLPLTLRGEAYRFYRAP